MFAAMLYFIKTNTADIWLLLIANIVLSFVVAGLPGRQRRIGFWSSLFTCLLGSVAVGLLVTLFSKKKQQQYRNDASKIEDGKTYIKEELNKLKLLMQCGVISKKEFEAEKRRLLEE